MTLQSPFKAGFWRALMPLMAATLAFPAQAQTATSPPAAPPPAPPAEKENNGTDPTRPIQTAAIEYEHVDLRGNFNSDTVFLKYTKPIGAGRTSVKFEAPLASVDVVGNRAMALGDVSVKLTHIPLVTRTHGIVLGAEMVFDSAGQPELGSRKAVFKPSVIYAIFRKDGTIIAPSVVHSMSLWGDQNRADVRLTTFDFYIVPHLNNPKLYMTIDPAFNVDWESNREYGAVAVTLGYRLGKMMGGNGQVFVKPSTTLFDERPTDWGLRVGFQLLGF